MLSTAGVLKLCDTCTDDRGGTAEERGGRSQGLCECTGTGLQSTEAAPKVQRHTPASNDFASATTSASLLLAPHRFRLLNERLPEGSTRGCM